MHRVAEEQAEHPVALGRRSERPRIRACPGEQIRQRLLAGRLAQRGLSAEQGVHSGAENR
jgi:phosphopantetheinyl transferase